MYLNTHKNSYTRNIYSSSLYSILSYLFQIIYSFNEIFIYTVDGINVDSSKIVCWFTGRRWLVRPMANARPRLDSHCDRRCSVRCRSHRLGQQTNKYRSWWWLVSHHLVSSPIDRFPHGSAYHLVRNYKWLNIKLLPYDLTYAKTYANLYDPSACGKFSDRKICTSDSWSAAAAATTITAANAIKTFIFV